MDSLTSVPSALGTTGPVEGMAFQPIQLSGSGSSVRRFTIPDREVAIAVITNTGSSSFTVWTVGKYGTHQELLVDVHGSYTGTVLFDEIEHSSGFDIESGGTWTIVIKPWALAFAWPGVDALGGQGDDVVQMAPPAGLSTSVSLTHSGSSQFAVWAYSVSGKEMLVNAMGDYAGDLSLPYATFLLEIVASGDWTVSPPAHEGARSEPGVSGVA